jgi:hypothetical protein
MMMIEGSSTAVEVIGWVAHGNNSRPYITAAAYRIHSCQHELDDSAGFIETILF